MDTGVSSGWNVDTRKRRRVSTPLFMTTSKSPSTVVSDESVHAKPFHSQRYDLAVDTISREEIDELVKWLQSYPRLTMADETKRFEEIWSKWLGMKYSVMCNSGSSANLLMYAAAEVSGRAPKKKIAVPATGWATTVAPAVQLGWQASMVESSVTTFGMNVDELAKVCEKDRPEVVIVVHVLGVPCDITGILELQKKYGFILLEDCCASHGALHKGRKIGTFGDMSSFSFYYGHHMSTIEGGVVSTNCEETYHHLLMLRSHGWLKDLPEEKANGIRAKYGIDNFRQPFTFVIPGYNLRPTDLNAVLGMLQIKKLDDTVDRRVKNHLVYQNLLKSVVDFAPGLPGDTISSISFCAVAKDSAERKKIVTELDKHNIDTRIFTAGNLGMHPFWFERYGKFSAPVANRLNAGGFFLPNNQTLGREQVEWICGIVRDAAKRS
jgi:CDP-4-dehydro-6-deoxyglucose reductase, E1